MNEYEQYKNTSVWDRNPDGTFVYPEALKALDRDRREAAIRNGVLVPVAPELAEAA